MTTDTLSPFQKKDINPSEHAILSNRIRKRHSFLHIGCPKTGTTNFLATGGKVVCGSCGKDFTDELRGILQTITLWLSTK